MYLDSGALLALMIALTSQMILLAVLFRRNYKLEQEYHRVVRLLKIERAARR